MVKELGKMPPVTSGEGGASPGDELRALSWGVAAETSEKRLFTKKHRSVRSRKAMYTD